MGKLVVNEPFFGWVRCFDNQNCDETWRVFLPDGCEETTKLECPKCHKMIGYLVSDTDEL